MDDELINLKINFEKYTNLNYVKSKLDPEEEPFKSKYIAREMIKLLIEKIDTNFKSTDGLTDQSTFLKSDEQKYLLDTYTYFYEKLNSVCIKRYSMSSKSFLASKFLEFYLARNYIETEEVETGEKLLAKIARQLDNLIDLKLDSNELINEDLNSEESPYSKIRTSQIDLQVYNPLIYNLKLSCFNELVYVWSARGNYKKCLQLLHVVKEIYEIYQLESNKNYLNETNCDNFITVPYDSNELICFKKDLSLKKRQSNFEALYTHSLFYFAQVYGKLDEKDNSAYYCELTLQRQIDAYNEIIEKSNNQTEDLDDQLEEKVSFNPLEWATHAAAISQYYVTENDFATARHCLCCSEAILTKLNKDAESKGIVPENLHEQTNSIRRCWGKYALGLLTVSKLKLRESADLADQKTLLAEIDRPSKYHFNLPESLYNLKECEKTAITSNIALDYEQARQIFLQTQAILNEAKEFFKLDGYVSDHCEIIRDISDLYSCLLFFEEDLDRRCKMYKRRLDILIPTCEEISAQFYLTIKRQLLFDIGTIYSELMDTKLEIFQNKKEKKSLSQTESASAILKINQLAKNSLNYFEQFLDTMKVQPKREVLPDKFDDHNVRPALLAKFYIGRLYSKIITVDSVKRLSNIKMTFDDYSYIVDYCDKESKSGNQAPLEIMKVEYEICKEMVHLLPAQMDKIRATL
jgi:hypothetical protein